MSMRLSRRQFLQQSALMGAGIGLGLDKALAQNTPAAGQNTPAAEKLNLGIIGVANRGKDNLAGVRSQNIVALCDVHEGYLALAATQFPQAKTYNDFRKLLEQKGLDAVVISTPDHIHAPAAIHALQAGLHVYCEKPLAHTVYEARKVAEQAAQSHKATQMGIQIHAGNNYRRVVELIQSGAIGNVRESHVWVERIWSGKPPPAAQPVPAYLHWDLWLGPASDRSYSPDYLPQKWRGWWDFGNGTLGDMGCHHMDLSFWALDLRAPQTIRAEGPPTDPQVAPSWLIATYEYAARGDKPPVTLTWYQGNKRPALFAEGKLPQWGDGTLFVGEKGMLLADYDRHVLLPEQNFAGFVPPKPTIPDSIGHYEEWFAACRTGSPTTCNFDYAGALSEAVLLGNVAYRTGQTLHWDPQQLRATNCPEADPYLRSPYRPGWDL